MTNREDLIPGGSPDFLILLVLHLLTPLSPGTGPADGELAMEEGEDPRGPSQCLAMGCRGGGGSPARACCWSWVEGEFVIREGEWVQTSHLGRSSSSGDPVFPFLPNQSSGEADP